MARYVWFSTEWSGSYKACVENIRAQIYTPDIESGFILKEVRENQVIGRFIERKNITVSVVDPFGVQIDTLETRYEYTDFILSNALIGLLLIDPPRATKGFLNVLSAASKYHLGVGNISLDVLQLIQYLRDRYKQVEISKLSTAEFALADGALAKLSLQQGADLLKTIEGFPKALVKEAKILLRDDKIIDGICFVNRSGGCTIETRINRDHLLHDIEAFLASCL